MVKYILLFTFVLIVSSVSSLYSPSDEVIELTASNFNSKVIQGNDLWLVEFYAPWCGHCKNLAPEWAKAAKALKGIVKVGAVNMDVEKSFGSQYNIQGFPTIKIFSSNKNSPSDYNGGRTAQAIVDEALSQLKNLVKQRLGGGGGSSGGSGGSRSGGSSSGSGDSKDVIELTDANFESTVLDSNDIWLVEFYAPWCGHCKNLAPEWARAATELKGRVKLGALDATVHQSTSQRYGIKGFPTIKYFGPGSKDSPSDYDGGRTSSDIVSWALNKAAENAPPPELIELVDQSKLEGQCDNKQLCLIAFFPSLFDCQSKCRNDYIKLLTKLGDKFKRNQWGWLWTESAKHPNLENALSVGGFGYPAMVAVNSRKGKYVLLKGSFSEAGINEFLRELSFGRGSPAPLPNNKLPTIENVSAWDGKDAKIELEEEIDLSDVSLDDLDDSIPIRKKNDADL